MRVRRRLRITGRVQGVFYRDWFTGEARAIGVEGWVRNRMDGSVVQGSAEMVQAAIAKARIGSPASRVADVSISDDESADILNGFVKRPTV
ncbi:acylphosphatase [Sphingomonas sp. SUN019]|uniref:acylphosphatase n=1 Tax=Sphingomonas sp. SUN019 TaxID=2937788 RepID=UPI002164EA36|nr:acylphosphatase [Sphingomonas sp. SUN019]UVO51094.1 acylphosphatase [Sphingomonas sp. SUN019]